MGCSFMFVETFFFEISTTQNSYSFELTYGNISSFRRKYNIIGTISQFIGPLTLNNILSFFLNIIEPFNNKLLLIVLFNSINELVSEFLINIVYQFLLFANDFWSFVLSFNIINIFKLFNCKAGKCMIFIKF